MSATGLNPAPVAAGYPQGYAAPAQAGTAAELAALKARVQELEAQLAKPAPAASPLATGLRSRSCGELRMAHVGQTVHLCGWVQMARDMHHFAFVDLRDRYGITQVVFNNTADDAAAVARYQLAKGLGRECVVRATGVVVERSNKNAQRGTGDVEVVCSELQVLNESKLPPFKIEDATDAAEDTRMKHRFLDIRRGPVFEALRMRHQVAQVVRQHLSGDGFIEVETPILIKSTPEGARDFVVPTRTRGQFYALPQSPQLFKQLLMVGGVDRYMQIAKCFRDEELRADRQPEFTQVDCEMSFVNREDVLGIFERLITAVFKQVKGVDLKPFPRLDYATAMREYGIDKPDLRYEMKLTDLTALIHGQAATEQMPLFKNAGLIVALAVPQLGSWSTKKVKDLEKRAKTEAGAQAMVWVKVKELVGSAKPYATEDMKAWASACGAKDGDLLCIFAGPGGLCADKTREVCGKWRHIMGTELGLRSEGFSCLWVVDFPLLEWDEDRKAFCAMHHPFTSCLPEDEALLATKPGEVRANAYDMVINGVEVGGGSIRLFERAKQMAVLELLGFTKEAAEEQFGFLLSAFEYGAPPHGGLAFGLDRMCTVLNGARSIRDFIAFPKNSTGRDPMIDAPGGLSDDQLAELSLKVADLPKADAPKA